MIEFDTTGLEHAFQETLAKIEDSVSESVLRTVGFAGAEIFRDEAKQRSLEYRRTGLLYGSIIAVRLQEESDGGKQQVYLVTVRNGGRGRPGAFYWRFLEAGHAKVRENKKVSLKTGKIIGWKAHRAREAKYWEKQAAKLENGSATVAARPFMRPAYESKKQEVVDLMTRTLAEQIARNANDT